MSNIIEEANRCLKCKVPMCSKFCPIGTPVPDVMNLFLEGKILEAGKLLFENNPMSAITSIVCPHEKNCAGHCVLGKKGTPVEFFRVEEYISGMYLDACKLTPPESNGIRIAVIGGGPAGITASILLALKGFKVTLIEEKDRLGGVLRYGIPEFRLPKHIVDKYAHILKELGVQFKPNTFIGSSTTVDDLFVDGYKAVFIAVGTAKPHRLGLLGETLGHVHYAIDYLKSPESYSLGDEIVIIGDGNVALDAARMAVRKNPGAKVSIVSLTVDEDMPGNREEIEMTKLDGVQFLHLLSAIRIDDDHIVCAKMNVTENEDGTRTYEEEMTERITLPATSVILAIGQGPQGAVVSSSTVDRTNRGFINADEDGITSKPGVFAAGDIVTGPSTVVQAVAYAKKAAEAIAAYCLEQENE